MSLPYTAYRYLWPPRPEIKVAPGLQPDSWWVETKMNGTCCLLAIAPDKTTIQRGRHGDSEIVRWHPGPEWAGFARSLPGTGWYVFVGELLHLRGVGIKDTLYLFDLLVEDGEYLIGETLADRRASLIRLFGTAPISTDSHLVHPAFPNVWIARHYPAAFGTTLFQSAIQGSEGVVFKNPNARLLPCSSSAANAKWQAKCRRATDTLSF